MRSLGRLAEHLLNIMASTVLFSMVMLTTVDVAGRYVFNAPLKGAFELTELMMAVLICAGLPLVSRRGEHVTVDLIDHFVGARLQRVHRAVVEFVSGALLLGLGILLWDKARQAAGYGDTTTVLEIKLAPFVYAMMAFLLLAGVVHVIRAFTPTLLGDLRDDRTV